MDTPSWPALIRALIGKQALTAEQAAWAMNEIMEGAATPAQIAGFGVALRAKGETPAEMSGLAASMLRHATPINIPGPVTDLVGTGGDGALSVNVSTMATIVAAAAGVPMVKHGNRAASSACGAADVLEELGVVIDLPAAATETLFAETGVAFLFAALYHSSLRHAGPVRAQLGVPTAFNYLGPLTNPARPSSLAVGVADPAMGPVLAGVYAGRGESALVFHGGGLDELSTIGPSTVWVAVDGTVRPPSTRRRSGSPGRPWTTCAAATRRTTPPWPAPCWRDKPGRCGTSCCSTRPPEWRPPRASPRWPPRGPSTRPRRPPRRARRSPRRCRRAWPVPPPPSTPAPRRPCSPAG
jgi:anthranilate phosphoribosyltransferase